MIPRHVCERCLEYMKVNKTSEGYALICPCCEAAKDSDDENYC